MWNIELSEMIKLIAVMLIAFWVYRLSKTHERALDKSFEAMEFCGQSYVTLDLEEKHFSTRLLALVRLIQQKRFGVICKEKEPILALLPIEEFLRLKAIEEHLDDLEIAKIIEDRIKNRDKADPHPMVDFEHFREGVYKQVNDEKK